MNFTLETRRLNACLPRRSTYILPMRQCQKGKRDRGTDLGHMGESAEQKARLEPPIESAARMLKARGI